MRLVWKHKFVPEYETLVLCINSIQYSNVYFIFFQRFQTFPLIPDPFLLISLRRFRFQLQGMSEIRTFGLENRTNLVRLSDVQISDIWDQPNKLEQNPVPNRFKPVWNCFCVWQTERFRLDFRQRRNLNCLTTERLWKRLKSKCSDFGRSL